MHAVRRRLIALSFALPALLLLGAAPDATVETYLSPGQPDAVALLAPPPEASSAEEAAELEEVRSVVKNRTSADEIRANDEIEFGLEDFAADIGPFFKVSDLPKTQALFREVISEAKASTDVAKK